MYPPIYGSTYVGEDDVFICTCMWPGLLLRLKMPLCQVHHENSKTMAVQDAFLDFQSEMWLPNYTKGFNVDND